MPKWRPITTMHNLKQRGKIQPLWDLCSAIYFVMDNFMSTGSIHNVYLPCLLTTVKQGEKDARQIRLSDPEQVKMQILEATIYILKQYN